MCFRIASLPHGTDHRSTWKSHRGNGLHLHCVTVGALQNALSRMRSELPQKSAGMFDASGLSVGNGQRMRRVPKQHEMLHMPSSVVSLGILLALRVNTG